MAQRTANAPRRFRFSLRSLLILTACCAVALGWFHRARQLQLAVQALRTSNPGVNLLYDCPSLVAEYSRKWHSDFGAIPIGVDLFYATDADLECLARLPRVQFVSLERSIDLTDDGLRHLARLKQLRRLTISDAEQVTNVGLRHLQVLTSLEYLQFDLGRHPVSREALRSLRRALPNCRIEVGGTRDNELAVARSGANCGASRGRAGG